LYVLTDLAGDINASKVDCDNLLSKRSIRPAKLTHAGGDLDTTAKLKDRTMTCCLRNSACRGRWSACHIPFETAVACETVSKYMPHRVAEFQHYRSDWRPERRMDFLILRL